MKSDYLKMLFMFLLMNSCYILMKCAEIEEDSWMDPDAWARDYLPIGDKSCKCLGDASVESSDPIQSYKQKQQTLAEDAASFIYFKKFISTLFNRKNFKYDSNQQLYKRSVLFTVVSQQMDKLEQLQDPRDLDNILTEIFKNVRVPNMDCDGQQVFDLSGFTAIAFNIFYDIFQLLNTSEVRFLLVLAVLLIIAWIINIRFKVGWLPLVFGSIFLYGYLHTYLECNRELEVNNMLEIINREKSKQKSEKFSIITSSLKSMFYSAHNDDEQQLRKSAKLSLGFCRPDHVIVMYLNDIFIRYLQVLIEQSKIALTALNGSLGFPYTLLSGFLYFALIGYIIKLTFKYILNPSSWSYFMHRKQRHQPEQEDLKSSTTSQVDRISGDNLKLFLNVMNTMPHRVKGAPALSTAAVESRVEDVEELIESNITYKELDTSTIDKNESNNSNKSTLDEKALAKIEDVPHSS